MFTSVPLFIFPVDTIVIDDNRQFADHLKITLGKNFRARIFTNPQEALKYLKQVEGYLESFLAKYTEESIDNHDVFSKGVWIKLSELYKQIYDNNRFNIPALLVVDYGMPQLTGEEFCKALQNEPYKKLMLTGEVDVNMGVHLFNEGLIDKFVLKSADNYMDTVAEYVKGLKIQYFVDLSEKLLASLNPGLRHLYLDPVYIRKFEELFLQYNAVESYALDDTGSHVLIDAKAEHPMWFSVKSEEEMNMLYELSKDDPETPAQVIEWLKNREKLTHFRTNADNAVSAKFWPLYDAKRLETTLGTYYYAVIPQNDYLKLDHKDLLSYHQFLSET